MLFDEQTKREFVTSFDLLPNEAQAFLCGILENERDTLLKYLRTLIDEKPTEFVHIRQHIEKENRKLIKQLEEKDLAARRPDEILTHLEVMF